MEVEQHASHVAADVIFRTLFSIPIEHEVAGQVFDKFREHQRSQPVLNLGALAAIATRWMPRFHKRKTRETAKGNPCAHPFADRKSHGSNQGRHCP